MWQAIRDGLTGHKLVWTWPGGRHHCRVQRQASSGSCTIQIISRPCSWGDGLQPTQPTSHVPACLPVA